MLSRLCNPNPRLLRLSAAGSGSHKVNFIELFFDLVFVFAVTQISHALLHHLSWAGLLQALVLLLAIWWVWVFTTWISNWLDPEQTPVRLMLLVLMLAGLLLSASIPHAFDTLGLAFAGAYVAMQLLRTLFALWAVYRHDAALTLNFWRMLVWLTVAGGLWLAGGLSDDYVRRLLLWSAALLVEYTSPSLGFWVPALGRSSTRDWNIEGEHLAERCGLFVIIALGESILLTGQNFSEGEWNASTVAAMLVAFLTSVTMWWLYFNVGAEHGSQRLERSTNPGRLARLAYTYLHLPIVAGIVIAAVADEVVLERPSGLEDETAALLVLGGSATYLLGIMLFKWATAGRLPLSHAIAIAAVLALGLLMSALTTLGLAAASAAVLVALAGWEHYDTWRCDRGAPEVDVES